MENSCKGKQCDGRGLTRKKLLQREGLEKDRETVTQRHRGRDREREREREREIAMVWLGGMESRVWLDGSTTLRGSHCETACVGAEECRSE
jgi:hypothetical protein